MIGSNNCLGSPPSEDAARPEGLPRKRGGTGDYKGAALISHYHSSRAGGHGGNDLWYSQYRNGSWQEPVNIEGVNSEENEGYPFVTSDGGELWFTRSYLGTPGIFRSMKVNGTWQEPELILSQFAGEPTLDIEGDIYFVHHFYEDGAMIEADIYVAYRK